MHVHVCKLAPLEARNESGALYLAFVDGELADEISLTPADDARALSTVAERFATATERSCSVALAATGVTLGFDPLDTPQPILEQRLECALALAERAEGWGVKTCLELVRAAKAFADAAPWKGWGPDDGIRARAVVEDRTIAFTLRLEGAEHPDGPALVLEDDGDAAGWAMAVWGLGPAPVRMVVRLTDWPAFATEAMKDATAFSRFPHLTCQQGGALFDAADEEILAAAAAMRAAAAIGGGAQTPKGVSAVENVSVEVTLAGSKPSREERRSPADHDSRCRLLAHEAILRELEVDVPEPLDDYVIVMLSKHTAAGREALQTLLAASQGGELPFNAEGIAATWLPSRVIAPVLKQSVSDDPYKRFPGRRPASVRVVDYSTRRVQIYDLPYEPRAAARARKLHEERRGLAAALDLAAASVPRDARQPPREGTWRDPRRYLPDPVPEDWRVDDGDVSGSCIVYMAGRKAFHVDPRGGEDGDPLVAVFFEPQAGGEPVSGDDAASILGQLRGTGRFVEMEMVVEGERVPRAGYRVFGAPLEVKRRGSKGDVERTEQEVAELIERCKPALWDAVNMAYRDKRPLRDYCVVIGAQPSARDPVDGVVMTRALVWKYFPTPASDPFDLRGRFEERRSEDECVVFIMHDDGVEEMHVSLQDLQIAPPIDA
jgi:hypothetical protein